MANAWDKFWSFDWLPHPGYDSTADAAKAFFMPSAYASEKNASMQRETNAANRSLVELQNQQNIEQWYRENAYNDPSNAMQRLRGAGLNPALMYGNGAGQLSSAPSPTMQASHDESATFQQDDMLSKLITLAQVRNLNAQTDKTESETKTEEQMRQARYDNLVQSTSNLVQSNKEILQRIENLAKSGKLTDEQISMIKFDRCMQGKRYMLDKKDYELRKLLTDNQIEKNNADVRKTLSEKNITDRQYQEMIWTYAIRLSSLEKAVNLTDAQIEQAKATASKLGIEKQLNELNAYGNQTLLDGLKGNNGFANKVASNAVYAVERLVSQFGSGLFK